MSGVFLRFYISEDEGTPLRIIKNRHIDTNDFDKDNKTITLKASAGADDIAGELSRVLAVKVTKTSTNCKSNNGEIVIVDLIGNETAYKVTASSASIARS